MQLSVRGLIYKMDSGKHAPYLVIATASLKSKCRWYIGQAFLPSDKWLPVEKKWRNYKQGLIQLGTCASSFLRHYRNLVEVKRVYRCTNNYQMKKNDVFGK